MTPSGCVVFFSYPLPLDGQEMRHQAKLLCSRMKVATLAWTPDDICLESLTEVASEGETLHHRRGSQGVQSLIPVALCFFPL